MNHNQNGLYCQICLHIRVICFGDKSATVQQNDNNRTGHGFKKKYNLQYKIDTVQNSTNKIYRIDYMYKDMLGAKFKCNKYVC